MENAFDGILFSMKLKPSSGQRSVEVLSTIDQKHSGFDMVFLAEFTRKDFSQWSPGSCKQSQMQQVVCAGISRSVQPVLLVIDSNLGFVYSDVIRGSAFSRLALLKLLITDIRRRRSSCHLRPSVFG